MIQLNLKNICSSCSAYNFGKRFARLPPSSILGTKYGLSFPSRQLRRRQAVEEDDEAADRQVELAERSKEEEELAARVEVEVQRRVAEAIHSENIALRIQQKLVV